MRKNKFTEAQIKAIKDYETVLGLEVMYVDEFDGLETVVTPGCNEWITIE